MREAKIEQIFTHLINSRGGLCLKFTSASMNGVPDRIVLLPGGRIVFIEFKTPGAKPRPLQLRRIEQFRRLGFTVHIIDNPTTAKEVADALLAA